MKTFFSSVFLLIMSLTVFSVDVTAQKRRPRSVIIFSLNDGTPLTIAVNERYFQKYGSTITLKDLPGKKPYIKVYRLREYKDEKGGKAELVFSGNIKIDPGKSYKAVVNPQTQQLSLTEIELSDNVAVQQQPQYTNEDLTMSAVDTVSTMPQLEFLHQQMNRKQADMDKLKLAKSYVDNNTFSVDDVRTITSFLLFDDSKMDFVKYSYKNVSNKQDYPKLSDVFSNKDDQENFISFIESAK